MNDQADNFNRKDDDNNNNNNNDVELLGPVAMLKNIRDNLEPEQREFVAEFNAMPLTDRLELVMHISLSCRGEMSDLIDTLQMQPDEDNNNNNNDNNNNDNLEIPKIPPIIFPPQ